MPACFVSTFVIMWVMWWEESVTDVVRTVPMYSRPAIFFFCHTPNAWFTDVSASLRRMNGSWNLSANFTWLASESLLIPITSYPREVRRA